MNSFLTLHSWLCEKPYHILDADSKYNMPLESISQALQAAAMFLWGQLIQGGGEHCVINGVHNPRPSVWLLWLGNELLSEAILSGISWCWIRYSVSSQMMVLAEASCTEKANLNMNKISIPVRTKYCHFHRRSGPMQSPCHQVTGWSFWSMVPYLGPSVGLCCWQIWHLETAVARSA